MDNNLWYIGLLGFIAELPLLTIPVFNASGTSGLFKNKHEKMLLAEHTMLVVILMNDHLHKASFSPWLSLLSRILLEQTDDKFSKKSTFSNQLMFNYK